MLSHFIQIKIIIYLSMECLRENKTKQPSKQAKQITKKGIQKYFHPLVELSEAWAFENDYLMTITKE